MLRRIAATALTICLPVQAQALTIAGWEITATPDKDNQCTIEHVYKDASDNDAENAIVLVFGKDANGSPIMSMTFGYEKWSHTKGDTSEADFLVDDKVEKTKVIWKAAAPTIYVSLFAKPGELIDDMAYAKTLSIRFGPTNAARFETPGLGMALGGADVCRSLMK